MPQYQSRYSARYGVKTLKGCQKIVRTVGVEPTTLTGYGPKPYAYAKFRHVRMPIPCLAVALAKAGATPTYSNFTS